MTPKQTDLFENVDTKAHARHGNPETSKLAAKSVESTLRASQLFVLAQFRAYGDMHDKQLEIVIRAAEKAAGRKPMSPSGIRSRRSELSKPNMDRLDQIAAEIVGSRMTGGNKAVHLDSSFATANPGIQQDAINQLRREGFRSPLWDTGERATVDGRQVVVWGIAK